MFEGPLQDVIDEFSKLPGIGPKSAQRIALHLLDEDPENVQRFQNVLGSLQAGVAFCRICKNISQEEVCRVCADFSRDKSLVCVVEESKDIQVIERTGEYRGRYHVLGGALDPLGGIGPKELNITALVQRVGGALPDVATLEFDANNEPILEPAPDINEVIIATDPNTEGEATAAYLARLLRDFPGLSVSRLASGIPMGGDLEFVDELTLSRAFAGRTKL
ncbi:recombination mediator RecR [uncultured Corynebacterium sp.]|uniref:recombination mediator RecR n=1 Tax=uncultured Corynebacterium sp. TaxID=159447 RepID=UPI002599CA0E|nr:recombination mediator RecR [uncultured Corynebacterium sp.]